MMSKHNPLHRLQQLTYLDSQDIGELVEYGVGIGFASLYFVLFVMGKGGITTVIEQSRAKEYSRRGWRVLPEILSSVKAVAKPNASGPNPGNSLRIKESYRYGSKDVLSVLNTARQRVALSQQQQRAAERLEDGELGRFELGETTLLFVNLREIATGAAVGIPILMEATMKPKISSCAQLKFKARSYVAWLTVAAFVVAPEDTLHFLAVLMHTLYESIAYALEHLLIHALNTSKFQAQMAVFYLTIVGGLVATYAILRRVPAWLSALKDFAAAQLRQVLDGFRAKWETLPSRLKFELLTANAIGLAGGMMFLLA